MYIILVLLVVSMTAVYKCNDNTCNSIATNICMCPNKHSCSCVCVTVFIIADADPVNMNAVMHTSWFLGYMQECPGMSLHHTYLVAREEKPPNSFQFFCQILIGTVSETGSRDY